MAPKTPRLDLSKLGGVAARRAGLTLFGDSLREHGVVRLLGHGVDGEATDDLRPLLEAVTRTLVGLYAEYFGLAADDFLGLFAPRSSRFELSLAPTHRTPEGLLTVLAPAPGATLEVEREGFEWAPVTLRDGELAAVPGPLLTLVTAGSSPRVSWRTTTDGSIALTVAFTALPSPTTEPQVHPAFSP